MAHQRVTQAQMRANNWQNGQKPPAKPPKPKATSKRKPKPPEQVPPPPTDLFGEPVKKQEKPKSREESLLQSYCVQKFRELYPEYVRNFYAIPMGGKRDVITGAIMKREGALRGALDTFLSVPAGGYAGMYLEFKVGDNGLSEDQVLFWEAQVEQGYRCEVVRTVDDFFFYIEDYLQLGRVKSWKK